MLDRGLLLPLVRQTIGCSFHLVEKHAKLYEKYNTPDHQFALMQIRRVFERQSLPDSKKTSKRGTPYGTDDGLPLVSLRKNHRLCGLEDGLYDPYV